MPIKIPDLDKRTFEDLTFELVGEIPKFSRVWDDFNFSDPGITILEMLTWVGETLAYRTNRIPADTYRTFLYLLGGASAGEIDKQLEKDWTLDPDYKTFLEELKRVAGQVRPDPVTMRRKAVAYFKKPYLNVTAEDFRLQAKEANRIIPEGEWRVGDAQVAQQGEVAVVSILPQMPEGRNKSYFSLEPPITSGSHLRHTRNRDASLFYRNDIAKIERLLEHVRVWLEPRTLLGTVVEVNLVTEFVVKIVLELVLDPRANLELRARDIEKAIFAWLEPLTGGRDQNGWPPDQAPCAADMISLVLALPYVVRVVKADLEIYCGQTYDSGPKPLPPRAFKGIAVPGLTLNIRKIPTRNTGDRR